MEVETCGKFFVWTKTGSRPTRSHDTHESALKEAKRLAKKHPGKKFIVQQFHEKVVVGPTPEEVLANLPDCVAIAGEGQQQSQ